MKTVVYIYEFYEKRGDSEVLKYQVVADTLQDAYLILMSKCSYLRDFYVDIKNFRIKVMVLQ